MGRMTNTTMVNRSLQGGCIESTSIVTPYNNVENTIPYTGMMFSLEAKSTQFTIDTFELDVLLDLAGDDLDVEVYTTGGNFQVIVDDESSWTKIADTRLITTPGRDGALIPITDFESVTVQPGERRSFYITMKGAYLDFTANALDITGETAFSATYFDILVGSGLTEYKFPEEVDRVVDPKFAGVIHFTVNVPCQDEVRRSTVEYNVMIDRATTASHLTMIRSGIDQVLNKAMANDEQLLQYQQDHGLIKIGSPLSVSGKSAYYNCPEEWDVCGSVITTADFEHKASLDSGRLLYKLYALADEVTVKLQDDLSEGNLFYSGRRGTLASTDFILDSVPAGLKMDDIQLEYFEGTTVDFLAAQLAEFRREAFWIDITTQLLPNQRRHQRQRNLLFTKGLRGLNKNLGAVLARGTVYGTQAAYDKDETFAKALEVAVRDAQSELVNQLVYSYMRPGSIGSQSNSDLSYFATLSGVQCSATAIETVIPRSPANVDPPRTDIIDTGAVEDAIEENSGIAIYVGLVVAVLVLACIGVCVYRHFKRQREDAADRKRLQKMRKQASMRRIQQPPESGSRRFSLSGSFNRLRTWQKPDESLRFGVMDEIQEEDYDEEGNGERGNTPDTIYEEEFYNNPRDAVYEEEFYKDPRNEQRERRNSREFERQEFERQEFERRNSREFERSNSRESDAFPNEYDETNALPPNHWVTNGRQGYETTDSENEHPRRTNDPAEQGRDGQQDKRVVDSASNENQPLSGSGRQENGEIIADPEESMAPSGDNPRKNNSSDSEPAGVSGKPNLQEQGGINNSVPERDERRKQDGSYNEYDHGDQHQRRGEPYSQTAKQNPKAFMKSRSFDDQANRSQANLPQPPFFQDDRDRSRPPQSSSAYTARDRYDGLQPPGRGRGRGGPPDRSRSFDAGAGPGRGGRGPPQHAQTFDVGRGRGGPPDRSRSFDGGAGPGRGGRGPPPQLAYTADGGRGRGRGRGPPDRSRSFDVGGGPGRGGRGPPPQLAYTADGGRGRGRGRGPPDRTRSFDGGAAPGRGGRGPPQHGYTFDGGRGGRGPPDRTRSFDGGAAPGRGRSGRGPPPFAQTFDLGRGGRGPPAHEFEGGRGPGRGRGPPPRTHSFDPQMRPPGNRGPVGPPGRGVERSRSYERRDEKVPRPRSNSPQRRSRSNSFDSQGSGPDGRGEAMQVEGHSIGAYRGMAPPTKSKSFDSNDAGVRRPESPYGRPQTPNGRPQSPYGRPQSPYGRPQSPYGRPPSPNGPPLGDERDNRSGQSAGGRGPRHGPPIRRAQTFDGRPQSPMGPPQGERGYDYPDDRDYHRGAPSSGGRGFDGRPQFPVGPPPPASGRGPSRGGPPMRHAQTFDDRGRGGRGPPARTRSAEAGGRPGALPGLGQGPPRGAENPMGVGGSRSDHNYPIHPDPSGGRGRGAGGRGGVARSYSDEGGNKSSSSPGNPPSPASRAPEPTPGAGDKTQNARQFVRSNSYGSYGSDSTASDE